ncbi:MAG TPA: serine hydrolase [Thermomicrobiales bacterium]|nr:serine hydrolase [Thermomicrobiales bacterium]
MTASPGGDVVGSLAAGATVRVVDGPRGDRYLVSTPELTGWAPFSALGWTEAADPRLAAVEPLASFDSRVAASARLADAWLSVGVYDSATGRLYGGGSGGLIGSASMSKALLLAVALRQVEAGRFALDDVLGLLGPMIVLSDNDVPNDIWRMVGGDWGVSETLRDAGIEGIAIQDPWDWGQIAASGTDWARFFALLGSGQLLSPDHTALALELIENVIGEHRWGASTPGADRMAIGKNGWYLDEDPFDWRVASAGFVSAREGTPGVSPLVVVVVARYPGELGEGWGIDMATDLTELIVDHSRLRWAGSYLADRRELAALSPLLPPVFWTSGFHPVR